MLYKGKWRRPEDVALAGRDDPATGKLLIEYHERRRATPQRADAQSKLAQWCQQNGLTEEALAHYSEVVRLDPSRETAWKHLGYKREGNGWIKPDEQAARRLESERQKRADLRWKPKLEKLRDGLLSPNSGRREQARRDLAEIRDPRAVPMVCRVLATGGEPLQIAAVNVLGQIDGPSASNALASLAVFSQSLVVSHLASEKLTVRDPRDVIGRLINLVRRPYKYTVRKGSGPGTSGELMVDGETFRLQRLYQYSSVDLRTIPFFQNPYQLELLRGPSNSNNFLSFNPVTPYGDQSGAVGLTDGIDARSLGNLAHGELPTRATATTPSGSTISTQSIANGLWFMALQAAAGVATENEMILSQAIAENTRRNQAVQQSLADDVALVEAFNKQFNRLNDRVLPVLNMLSGLALGADPDTWKKWWTEQRGYIDMAKGRTPMPMLADTALNPITPPGSPRANVLETSKFTLNPGFAAGTPVRTVEGLIPIESVQIGDRVLSRNTTTGSLEFQVVTGSHVIQPSPTYRLTFNTDIVVATGIQRFWQVGRGWTMARDLKTGDRVRIVAANDMVTESTPADIQPAYHLDVADDGDLFVCKAGVMVHDFGFVTPVPVPFDQLTTDKPRTNPR
jgi:hypothetical protein